MGRKLRPVWQIRIDAYLFRYVDDPQTIRAQELRLKELELTGIKTTASYSPREGAGSRSSTTKEERYVLELERCREQIELSRERRALVDKMLQDHFSAEEQEFIRLFWLEVRPIDRGLIQARTQQVIREIGWLRDPDDRRRPSREYRRWRLRIYNKWWSLLFPDLPKEEWKEGYVEHIEIERETPYLNAEQLRVK